MRCFGFQVYLCCPTLSDLLWEECGTTQLIAYEIILEMKGLTIDYSFKRVASSM